MHVPSFLLSETPQNDINKITDKQLENLDNQSVVNANQNKYFTCKHSFFITVALGYHLVVYLYCQ